MATIRLLTSVMVISCCVLTVGCSRLPAEADLLLLNGRIYSLSWGEPATDGTPAADAPYDADGWHPDAEAIAISGDRIIYVGSNEGAVRFRSGETIVKDLAGATVIPGLVESHVHVNELAQNIARVDLRGLNSERDIVTRLEMTSTGVRPGEWIFGFGWDEGLWANRLPDNRLMSEQFPDNPVVLDGLHGFGLWANKRALELAGIDSGAESPSGGEIVRDNHGEPTGIFLNRAVEMVRQAIPPPPMEQRKPNLIAALNLMAADGYVAVHQAGTSSEMIQALVDLEREERLPIRVYAMVSSRDEDLTREWIMKGPDQDTDSLFRICAVKAYYDASLGSRGALLLEDYSDMPGHRGVSGGEYGHDEELVAEAMRVGFQASIHAIGDAGNRDVLDFYDRVLTEYPALKSNRHRIAHAQVLHPDDIPRFGELQIIASMQPPQTVEDKAWIEDRIGPERSKYAFAWRSLRLAGARIVFNSDLPGSDHSIFYGLHAAITRRDKNLEPPGGWNPTECLTPEEAVRAYTIWGAFAAFQEDATGILEKGRFADVTVMDIDPFVLGYSKPADLLNGSIVMTIAAGKIVHEGSK